MPDLSSDGRWCVLPCRWMWVLDVPFWHGGGCAPPMVICKCWAGLSDWVRYVLNKMNTYMEARPTTSMKKGWLYRTFLWWVELRDSTSWSRWSKQWWWWSSDDPALMMIQWWSIFDDDPMMIQWWWSSDDPIMMIQRWSSDDDPDLIQRRRLVLMNCVKRIPS